MRERQLIKDRSGQDFLADLLMAQTEPVTLVVTGGTPLLPGTLFPCPLISCSLLRPGPPPYRHPALPCPADTLSSLGCDPVQVYNVGCVLYATLLAYMLPVPPRPPE